MKTLQRNPRSIATIGLGAIASAVLLAACDPGGEGQTAGQKLDRALASVSQKSAAAADDARAAGNDVSRAAAEGVDKASDQVKDAAITTEINAKLLMDGKLSAAKINVDTQGGQVVLRGTAPDADARERATQLAMGVDGVLSVDNRLVVAGKT